VRIAGQDHRGLAAREGRGRNEGVE
jgi:hypothetical protein